MVDLTIARQPELGNLLLQASNGEPGLAPLGILAGVEHDREHIDKEPARFDQQPDEASLVVPDGRRRDDHGRRWRTDAENLLEHKEHNLWNDPAHAAVRERLMHSLLDWRMRSSVDTMNVMAHAR